MKTDETGHSFPKMLSSHREWMPFPFQRKQIMTVVQTVPIESQRQLVSWMKVLRVCIFEGMCDRVAEDVGGIQSHSKNLISALFAEGWLAFSTAKPSYTLAKEVAPHMATKSVYSVTCWIPRGKKTTNYVQQATIYWQQNRAKEEAPHMARKRFWRCKEVRNPRD